MRVLEKEVASSYSMGRKNKHKLRKSKDNDASDSSEEVASKGCVHVNKAVNFSAMKKGLGKQTFGECATCAKDAVKKGEPKSLIDQLEGATSSDFSEEFEAVIWVCLQCGNQGCGRQSQEKHSLKHYETPRSSQHNVVVNTSTWSAWCYECDDELPVEKYKKVAECVEHIKKLACVPLIDTSIGKNSNGSGASSDVGLNKGRPLSGKTSTSGCNKVKGLSNLGNTCFFNAVMQNLVQTYNLESLLGERRKGRMLKLQGHSYFGHDSGSSSDEGENERNCKNVSKDLMSIEVSISEPGPLTHALVVFLHDINTTSRSGCINPSALFGQVCKKAPRFKGMQQQDSHELLRYLMDNMKTEEIKRGQSGILKHFKLSENINPKKVDEETRYKVKAYGQEIKHTFVECLFGGQLISTVVCEECKYISQILEPFLDLSLPVTEEKPQRPNQLHHGMRKKEGIGGEDAQEMVVATDNGPSKHALKKQKKRQKRDSKRQSKGKSSAGEGKAEEDEGKDETEADKQEHTDNDSDADVEDNLESDTSRCYKSLSDTVIPPINASDTNDASPDSPHLSSHAGTLHGTQLDKCVSCPDNVTGARACGESQTELCAATFSVETSVHNHSSCLEDTRESSEVANGYILNCPIKVEHASSNGCDTSEKLRVSYTLSNGCLLENTHIDRLNGHACCAADLKTNNLDTEVTISCTNANIISNGTCEMPVPICNGDISMEHPDNGETSTNLSNSKPSENINDTMNSLSISDNKVNGHLKIESREACLGAQMNSYCEGAQGGCATSPVSGDVADYEARGAGCEPSMTDIGTDPSTMCDSTSTLASDLSRMTLKDECEGPSTGNTDATLAPHVAPAESIESACKSCAGSQSHSHRQQKLKELYLEGKKKSINTLAERYHPSSGECSILSCLHQFTAAELLTGNNKFGCKNCTKLKYKNNPHKEKKETVYSNANKQYLIFQPPAVLTLHLKRFEQVGFSSRKVNRHVDFPFVLDLAPYCSSLTQGLKHSQKKILYSLYGVVEHSGRLSSGHYTAYVKVRPNIGTLTNFLNKHNVTVKEYLDTYARTVQQGQHGDSDLDGVSAEGLVPPGRWYHISDSRVNEVTEASVERAQAYLLFYERIF